MPKTRHPELVSGYCLFFCDFYAIEIAIYNTGGAEHRPYMVWALRFKILKQVQDDIERKKFFSLNNSKLLNSL